MKLPTKKMSDTDTLGRVRRLPRSTDERQTVKVRLLDGPMAGREMTIDRNAEIIRIGAWLYTYAGKDGRTPLFCKLTASRAIKRFLKRIRESHGADPRVEQSRRRSSPITGKMQKQGRGAALRAHARLNPKPARRRVRAAHS